MKADEAVEVITQYVRETQAAASEAVRLLWSQIQPIEDSEDLIQFALAARVAVSYKKPLADDRPKNDIHIEYHKYKSRIYEVSVQLLQDVSYNVNGKVKPIILMNHYDLVTLARDAKAAEEGFHRYYELWTYTAERLQVLKKTSVEDLAEGEQMKIARMLHEAQRKLPSQGGMLAAG